MLTSLGVDYAQGASRSRSAWSGQPSPEGERRAHGRRSTKKAAESVTGR
jgi:hypothetical protein